MSAAGNKDFDADLMLTAAMNEMTLSMTVT